MTRMIRITILLLTLAACLPAAAQHTGTPTDTSELVRLHPSEGALRLEVAGYGITLGKHDGVFSDGDPDPRGSKPVKRFHVAAGIASVELGLGTLVGTHYGTRWGSYGDFMETTAEKSVHFAGEVAQFRYMLDRQSHWWLSLGVRFSTDDYGFSNPITLRRTDGIIHPVELDPKTKKSKLSVGYIGFPLRLTFSPIRKLNITLRASGDILFISRTKYKHPKTKASITGISPWRWTVGGTITYRRVGFYAEYCITPLFKPGAGPETHGVSAGLYIGF